MSKLKNIGIIALGVVAVAIVLICLLSPKDKTNGFSDDSDDDKEETRVIDSYWLGSYEQDGDLLNGQEKIEWLILEVKGGKALVISKNVIEGMPYHESRTNVTWETCTLRTWLNSEFLNNAFSENEKAKIFSRKLAADDNDEHDTDAGNETYDKVFLLSASEVEKYLNSDNLRACKPTEYAEGKGVLASGSKKNCYWWLRTPGEKQNSAVLVKRDLYMDGDYVDVETYGVRPAMWVSLSSVNVTASIPVVSDFSSAMPVETARPIETEIYTMPVEIITEAPVTEFPVTEYPTVGPSVMPTQIPTFIPTPTTTSTPMPTPTLKPTPTPAPTGDFYGVKTGDYIKFGSYEQDNQTSNGKEEIEWLVLDVKDGKALIISKYALDCGPYNMQYEDVTWENCTMRTWLNSTFYKSAFSKNERMMIASTYNVAEDNEEWSTEAGNGTFDNVFLLSISEADMYFKSSEDRQCIPTTYALAQGTWVNADNGNCMWWLRSPGCTARDGATVFSVGDISTAGSNGNGADTSIRPAMWIEIE